MLIYHLLLTANVFVVAFAWTTDNCPTGVSRDKYLKVFGDRCYEFELFRTKSHQDAQEYCEEDGGTLVLVKNKTINDYISKTSKQLYSRIPDMKVWTGLKYEVESKKYVSADGSDLEFGDNDNIQHGDDDKKLCVSINTDTGDWVDESCELSYRNRFVCEYTVSDAESKKADFPASIVRTDCPLSYDDERIIQVLGDTCYVFFIYGKRTFDQANELCNQFDNSTLANIHSKQVNDFIEYHIYTTHRFYVESNPVWIGLGYDSENKDYRWMDGKVPDYKNYRDGEGGGGSHEGCFVLSPTDGKWHEADCGHKGGGSGDGEKHFLVCEVKPRVYGPPVTATPATNAPKTTTQEPNSTTQEPKTTTQEPNSTTQEPNSTTQEPKTTTQEPNSTTQEPKTTTEEPNSTTQEPKTTTQEPKTATQEPNSTTEPVTTGSIPSNTTTFTTTNIPSTTAPTTTTTTIPTTTTTPPPPLTTCGAVICELDCGLDGYRQDPATGCLICACEYK